MRLVLARLGGSHVRSSWRVVFVVHDTGERRLAMSDGWSAVKVARRVRGVLIRGSRNAPPEKKVGAFAVALSTDQLLNYHFRRAEYSFFFFFFFFLNICKSVTFSRYISVKVLYCNRKNKNI